MNYVHVLGKDLARASELFSVQPKADVPEVKIKALTANEGPMTFGLETLPKRPSKLRLVTQG
jgi:hypothetical protein